MNIKLALAKLIWSITTRFDRGIEGIIGQLVALDDKLDAFAAKQVRIIDRTNTATSACYERIDAAAAKEAELLLTLREANLAAGAAAERAARIRERISKLID